MCPDEVGSVSGTAILPDLQTSDIQTLIPCNLCPRQCNVDRSQAVGWCRMDDRIHVSSIVLHRGEEPPISGEKGVVNVFFPSCNMQCIYCQNWEISCRGTKGKVMTLDEVCDAIIGLLPESENNLGFVSPSHFVLQLVSIVEELRRRGHFPTIIYNTNCYDLPDTIRSLESIVDIWLPDFKYSDDVLSMALSEAPHYSHFALKALKEMIHQVGTTLHIDDAGIARRGIIIRHLVLPGFVENSLGVLWLIANRLSPSLHISLMSQYFPPDRPTPAYPVIGAGNTTQIANYHSLKCTVSRLEYETVIERFHSLGLTRGWLQEFDSHQTYRPDFSNDHPFE